MSGTITLCHLSFNNVNTHTVHTHTMQCTHNKVIVMNTQYVYLCVYSIRVPMCILNTCTYVYTQCVPMCILNVYLCVYSMCTYVYTQCVPMCILNVYLCVYSICVPMCILNTCTYVYTQCVPMCILNTCTYVYTQYVYLCVYLQHLEEALQYGQQRNKNCSRLPTRTMNLHPVIQ